MIKKSFFKSCLLTLISCLGFLILSAQDTDNWYKVFSGKMGNYTATLHLHKSASNYSGYLWFLQNQWPMQLYYNEPVKKSDSLIISANSGPLAIVFYGVLSGNQFSGMSEMSKNNGAPKKAAFDMQVSTNKDFTSFNYYSSVGNASLPPQYKNNSQINFITSTIWPMNLNGFNLILKNEISRQLGIKTPVTDISKWLNDEKNKNISNWKKEYTKLAPKEIAELGLSISAEREVRVLIMYENDKTLTIAHYNFLNSGGAHGNFSTSLTTFSKQKGKKLVLTDVITNAGIPLLPRLLDQVARLQYGVKNNKSLDQNGFLVSKIEPSQDFYVTDQGIGFYFAPYKIKSFSDGEINLLIPFTALKNYLQPEFMIK